jgi:class 3 adenylate cyclase
MSTRAAHMIKEDISLYKGILGKTYKLLDEVIENFPNSKNTGTILFTDLVNSTARINLLGDEDYYENILLKHNTILLETIGDNDGRVIKNIGDAYLAIFWNGFNAIKCCIESQYKFNKMNEQRDIDNRILVRMALHCGEYSFKQVEHNNIDVYGSSINYAARMVGNTGGGQISVSKAFIDSWGAGEGFNYSVEETKKSLEEYGDLRRIFELKNELFKNITFDSIGLFNFKGFENEQELYCVNLSESIQKLCDDIRQLVN